MLRFLSFTKTRIRTAELKKKQSIVPTPKSLLSKEGRNNRQINREINRQMGDKQGNGQTCSFSRVVSDPSEHSICFLFSFCFSLVCLVLCMEWNMSHTNIYFEMKYDKELGANPVLVPGAVGDKETSCFLENLTGGRGIVDWGNKVTC